jgi:hypothetical protein
MKRSLTTLPPTHPSSLRTLPTVTCPAPRAVWQRLYDADPEAMPSQSPSWLDCLCGYGPFEDASRLYTFADGQQVVMPVVKHRALPVAVSLQLSLPYTWSVGGVVAKRPLTAEQLAAVFADLEQTPFAAFKLFPNPLQTPLWRAARPVGVRAIPRRAHILDLEGGFDRVWRERFDSKTRNKVRKAERSGLVVECDTTGRLVPVFESLYRISVDRWAQQQHEPRWLAHLRARARDPLRKTRHIAAHMGRACPIWVAWLAGEPVAASMLLVGHNVDGLRSASNKALAAPVCANDLLKKLIIEEACNAGCRYLHMGESGFSEGIAQFKERFGARPYDYEELWIERLPINRIDRGVRSLVKQAIGFRDV